MNNRVRFLPGLIGLSILFWSFAANAQPGTVNSGSAKKADSLRNDSALRAGNLNIIAGYEHKVEKFPNGNMWGRIWKQPGLHIMYVMGPRIGLAIRPQHKANYEKYWEQTVNGRVVRFAFTGPKMFVISVPLDETADSLNAANFGTQVTKAEDAVDMVAMALSLIPGKSEDKKLAAPRKLSEIKPQ